MRYGHVFVILYSITCRHSFGEVVPLYQQLQRVKGIFREGGRERGREGAREREGGACPYSSSSPLVTCSFPSPLPLSLISPILVLFAPSSSLHPSSRERGEEGRGELGGREGAEGEDTVFIRIPFTHTQTEKFIFSRTLLDII